MVLVLPSSKLPLVGIELEIGDDPCGAENKGDGDGEDKEGLKDRESEGRDHDVHSSHEKTRCERKWVGKWKAIYCFVYVYYLEESNSRRRIRYAKAIKLGPGRGSDQSISQKDSHPRLS